MNSLSRVVDRCTMLHKAIKDVCILGKYITSVYFSHHVCLNKCCTLTLTFETTSSHWPFKKQIRIYL